jgi:hypothetical protein
MDCVVCIFCRRVTSVTSVFDDVPAGELVEARQMVGDAGLEAARGLATERLVAGPASGLGKPAALVELLLARDVADARWERLGPFELRWSLLVLRLLDGVVKDPSVAVHDARRRGATWVQIAAALGVKTPSAHARFRHVG